MYTPSSNNDGTYFYSLTGSGYKAGGYFDLTLRLRRLDNVIHTYYKVPDGDWVEIGQPTPLAQEIHNVPLHFGCRVKKEWKTNHQFTLTATKMSAPSTPATDAPSTLSPSKKPTKAPVPITPSPQPLQVQSLPSHHPRRRSVLQHCLLIRQLLPNRLQTNHLCLQLVRGSG